MPFFFFKQEDYQDVRKIIRVKPGKYTECFPMALLFLYCSFTNILSNDKIYIEIELTSTQSRVIPCDLWMENAQASRNGNCFLKKKKKKFVGPVRHFSTTQEQS
jgi:hypothetical protein